MQRLDSDRTLVRASQLGDRLAWEALIRRYERLIYTIPLQCSLSSDDAADVFHAVCVSLFQNLEHLGDQEFLARWLMTTTLRETRRVQRLTRLNAASDIEPDKAGDVARDGLSANDPVSDELAIRLEEEQMVRQAVQELGDPCLRLLESLYAAGPAPSYAEIASRLGVPEDSIGPARARCLRQLREILQRMGF